MKLISKQRYSAALMYCLRRQLTAPPGTPGRKYWAAKWQAIFKGFYTYRQGETI